MAEDGQPPATVALLGTGVIGGGWAARLLLAGVDVRLFDPHPGAVATVDSALERARRAWAGLTAVPLPPGGSLTVHGTVAEAVAGAELIQESAPEREAVKRPLLAEASRAAAPDAIIASSTSGLRPSLLDLEMERPQRFVVAHPFNPVYLLPLVEVCGSPRTSPATVERAVAIYRSVGMQPLVVRREIDGFIADRLLEALWREALWLVADDVATAREIDDAIRYGPGLRWAAMGTFLTYRLAGGENGMRHFMAQFGPTLEQPWSRLTDVPELDDPLLDKLVAQSDAQAAGRSIDELTQIRDDCLVGVLRALRDQSFGAGEVLARTERELLARAQSVDGSGPAAGADGRLVLHHTSVVPEWLDYNGHMTESRYLHVLGDATDALLLQIGIDTVHGQSASGYYTVETHIRHLREAHLGERLYVATQLLGYGEKRLHLWHELYRHSDGALLATGEHLLLHVDRATGRTAPAAEAVLAALAEIEADQRSTEWPEAAGAHIGGR
ncbi:MAG TPA: carnitine 3-dehydrogenase [Solirubrobacteraceae bacterium]